MKPAISVLVAARKNSKYLAKFLAGFRDTLGGDQPVEVLIMLNAGDTWNGDIIDMFKRSLATEEGFSVDVRVFYEDLRLGRGGLHRYFNELLGYALGSWIVYFCEDHYIIMRGWDTYILRLIKERRLKSSQPWIIVPKWDNTGAVNHVVSRGYINLMDGLLGRHGWIDSYINRVNYRDKVGRDHTIRIDPDMFHDFTADQPSPMTEGHMQSEIGEDGRLLPKFDSPEVEALVQADADRLRRAWEL